MISIYILFEYAQYWTVIPSSEIFVLSTHVRALLKFSVCATSDYICHWRRNEEIVDIRRYKEDSLSAPNCGGDLCVILLWTTVGF